MSHVKLIFWDLGGQKELQSLWDKVLYNLFLPTWVLYIIILFEGLDARGVYISREWVIVKKKC